MVSLHKPGELIDAYSDPEVNVGPLGKIELISFIRTGLPFVIEDNKVSKDLNKVYNLEFWLATIVESKNKHFPVGYATIFPIRVFNTVGQTTEYSNEPSQVRVIKDDFTVIEDYDTSFWENRVEDSELSGSLY